MNKNLLLLIAILFINGCAHINQHWSYEGIESPEHWAELSSDYLACGQGHHQSPIDLHNDNALPSKQQLIVAYLPTHAHIVNNGHTIEFDMEEERKNLAGLCFTFLQNDIA